MRRVITMLYGSAEHLKAQQQPTTTKKPTDKQTMINWLKNSLWSKVFILAIVGGILAAIGTNFTDTLSALIIFVLSGLAVIGFVVGIILMIKYDK